MCDGFRDESAWTIKFRATSAPLETAAGFTFIFSDESDAVEFLRSRADAAALEVVALPNPE